ncbi:hypothetical protein TBLA_0A05090 [Henningerozyma blattae CBS 6284]|uniref:VHS domain-containing protein n=1 Tax=Henningerozyma blattae (strain ATCC 34711 / CBS 6284 / DSM 70876 / NBRC 10599 / NRRL Y-10934 / UCD 77-7) TaxID=1071380 RepID=I2GW00_HENB6|nr:hypothetical protein TBLA_0A05090 [Tetrapisispora blattae CBS 6284]CCH58302.1 hypothetical protein TBLA_0A05090 [Tetrapisispora blattae CBS 6284]
MGLLSRNKNKSKNKFDDDFDNYDEFTDSGNVENKIKKSIDHVSSKNHGALEDELNNLLDLIETNDEYQYYSNQKYAAKIMRKNLKFGYSKQHIRILQLLDLLIIQHIKFTIVFNDEKLLKRIRGIANNSARTSQLRLYDSKVIMAANNYITSWQKFIESNNYVDNNIYYGLLQLSKDVGNDENEEEDNDFDDVNSEDNFYSSRNNNTSRFSRTSSFSTTNNKPDEYPNSPSKPKKRLSRSGSIMSHLSLSKNKKNSTKTFNEPYNDNFDEYLNDNTFSRRERALSRPESFNNEPPIRRIASERSGLGYNNNINNTDSMPRSESFRSDISGHERLRRNTIGFRNERTSPSKLNYNNNNNMRPKRTSYMDDTPNDPDKLYRIPNINLSKAEPKIRTVIADALTAAVSLKNAVTTLPSYKLSTEDESCTKKFIKARAVRRKILSYLQLVKEGELLGSLIHANEELVNALTLYDKRSGLDEEENFKESFDARDHNSSSDLGSEFYDPDDLIEEERFSSDRYSRGQINNPFVD